MSTTKAGNADTLRRVVFDAESDMRSIYDLALILHETLGDRDHITADMQNALVHVTGALCAAGLSMRATHERLRRLTKNAVTP